MVNSKRYLQIWVDPDAPLTQADAALPTLREVAYTSPNPDGSRKNCLNCTLWAMEPELCLLHGPDVLAGADFVCSYHVYGRPAQKLEYRPQQAYLDPECSGLTQASQGSTCDRCRYFETRGMGDGICRAVIGEEGEPAIVQAFARCSRWEEYGSG